HSLTTQSIAHGDSLHARVSSSTGHAAPPFAASTSTVRVLVCTPPPHVSVHSLHSLHSLTMQSTGSSPPSARTVTVDSQEDSLLETSSIVSVTVFSPTSSLPKIV